jgi:hypothetical protein
MATPGHQEELAMTGLVLDNGFQPKITHRTEVLHVRSMEIDPVAVLPLDRINGRSLAAGGCDIGGCAIGDVGGCDSGIV